jgi:hypothetical protein
MLEIESRDFLMMTLFRSLTEDGASSEKFFTVSSIIFKVVVLFLEDMYSVPFILTSLLLQLFQGSAFKKRQDVCVRVCARARVCVCVLKKLKAFKK